MRTALASLILAAGLVVGCSDESDTGFKSSTGHGTGNQGSPAGGQTNSSFDKSGEQKGAQQAGVKVAPPNNNNATTPTTSPNGSSAGGSPGVTGPGATGMAP